MIEKTTSFKTSDGVLHATIELAQQSELVAYLISTGIFAKVETQDVREIATAIIAKKEHVIDILTMKASSHPRARKVNGAKKKRDAKKDATPEMI